MKPESNLKPSLIILVLLICTFLAISTIVFLSTLLVDIAGTFNVPIGTASQIILVINLMGLFVGLAMGALTLRFRHKALFICGVGLYAVGMLGFFFAPNFATVIGVNFAIGIGIGIIHILTLSFIGDLVPIQKRGAAVGLVFSVTFLAFVFIGPISGVISQLSGWRSFLILFSVPLSMICLVLSWVFIPDISSQHIAKSKPKYTEAYKVIFKNKSASACLIGAILLAVFNSIPLYGASFYRITFLVSPALSGIFSALAAAGGIFGAAAGGRLVNRCGRRYLTIVGSFVCGAFAITMTYLPIMWVSVVFWAISASFAALTMAAMSSLLLEQVPSFRASMMSMNETFRSAGTITGIVIGGLVLNFFANDFQLLMTVFGSAGITLGVVIFFFAKDPCK